MAKRLVVLAYTVDDEHGPIDELLFMSLLCDDCRTVVRLEDGFDVLAGWTTRGDLEGGWTDWCPVCSARRAASAELS